MLKATPEGIKHGIRELVYRSYAAPQDPTFVHAWQNIATPLMSHHPMAVWMVMEHCTQIMKEQTK